MLLYNPEGGVNWPNGVPMQENGKHSGPSFLKPDYLTMGRGEEGYTRRFSALVEVLASLLLTRNVL